MLTCEIVAPLNETRLPFRHFHPEVAFVATCKGVDNVTPEVPPLGSRVVAWKNQLYEEPMV